MIDFETDLRTTLAERAAASAAPEFLPGVRQRSRDRQRRRRVLVTGAVVVAVAGLGAVAPLTVLGPDDRGRSALDVSRPPASHAPVPIDLERVPEGFSEPTAILYQPGVWVMRSTRDDPPMDLEVHVTTIRPAARQGLGTRRTLDLDGVPAAYFGVTPAQVGGPKSGPGHPEIIDGAYGELIYQRKPGQWIRIVGQDAMLDEGRPLTEQEFRDIAGAIVDRAHPVPEPMTFAAVPDGLEYGHVDFGRGQISLNRVGARYEWTGDPDSIVGGHTVDGVGISLVRGGGWLPYESVELAGKNPRPDWPTSHGENVPVGGRIGTFIREPWARGTVLVVPLAHDRFLVLHAVGRHGLSKQDLVALAAGVTVAKGASFQD